MKALIVTASIVLSALLLCVAWLAFFPGDAGGPVISVAVTPPPPKPSAPPPPKAAPAPSIDLPPGFGISPVRPQSGPGGAAGSQQQQAGTPAQPGAQGQPQPVGVQTVAVPPPVAPPPGLPPPPEVGNSLDHARRCPSRRAGRGVLNMGRFPRSQPMEGGPLTFMRVLQNMRSRRLTRRRASRC